MQKQADKIQKREDYLEDLRQNLANYSADLDRIEEARRQQVSFCIHSEIILNIHFQRFRVRYKYHQMMRKDSVDLSAP